MKLDEMTLGDFRNMSDMLRGLRDGIPEHAYPVGKNVFVRTVTMHYTGKLERVTAGELVLREAAWIPDSGRFNAALSTGDLNEVEPFPSGEVVVSRSGVIDVSIWSHSLPRTVK